jgi:photosystem II stability/assembly factor-like uncharacterized protein
MNEQEVERLVRSRIQERKASVPVPDGLGDHILRSLRTKSRMPGRRLGRELLAAAALIVMAAVVAGGIAWARGYWGPQPAGPSGLAHFSAYDLSFDYPARWRAYKYENTSSFSSVLVYLSTQGLHDPCTRSQSGGNTSISCGQPLDHLNDGAVLVTWTSNGFPRWTIDGEKGNHTSIGGQPAVLRTDKPGDCAQIGGEETITATIARDAPSNFYRMVACLNGRNRAADERDVNAMLQSVVIGSVSASPSASAQPSPLVLPSEIAQLQMVTPTIGWALQGQSVLHTEDGAAHWHDVTPAAALANGNQVTAAYFLDAGHAWIAAVPAPGPNRQPWRATFFSTADDGKTWTRAGAIDAGYGGTIAQLDFVDSLHGWLRVDLGVAAGSSGLAIYQTVDGGSHWILASKTNGAAGGTTPGSVPLACLKDHVTFVSPIRGWVTGNCYGGGLVFYRSDDGGHTWQAQSLPAPWGKPLTTIRQCQCGTGAPQFTSLADGTLTVSAYQNNGPVSFLYVTHDGGTTWSARPLPAPSVAAVDFVSGGTGWTVTVSGSVYETADGGAHWQPRGDLFRQTPGPPVEIVVVDFVDQSRGWAVTRVGIHSSLLRTTDGGRTWSTLS